LLLLQRDKLLPMSNIKRLLAIMDYSCSYMFHSQNRSGMGTYKLSDEHLVHFKE